MPTVEFPLATPPKGAAWAYRFDPDGKAAPMPADPALVKPEAGSFTWIHLDLADVRARHWAAASAFLSEESRDALLTNEEQAKLIAEDNTICGVLPDHTRYLDEEPGRRAWLHFAVGESVLVTARRRPLQAAAHTRAALEAGRRAHDPLDLLETIVTAIVKGLADETAALARDLDSIEDRVLDDEIHDERRRLGPLRRSAVRLHRQLGVLRDPFARLTKAGTAPLTEPILALKNAALQEIDSLHRDLSAVQDRARLLQEEVSAKLTAETNRHLYVLTVLTSILMPAALVTGVFGMNTKGLPFGDDDNGFLYAILICLGSSGFVFLLMSVLGVGRAAERQRAWKKFWPWGR